MSVLREYIIKPLSRSRSWPKVRREHLKNQPVCQACGRKTNLEVHHIKDFSNNPELELDLDNLITLCSGSTKCHFVFGHFGYWKLINENVCLDTIYFKVNKTNAYGVLNNS